MERLVTEWFTEVLKEPPPDAGLTMSTRGRLALLLADMPCRWQDQFLRPGPWPEEFVTAMREITCVPARIFNFQKWRRVHSISARFQR